MSPGDDIGDGGEPEAPQPAGGQAHVIDLRRFDPPERLPLLELSVCALEPGEALEIVLATRPERLEQHLARRFGEQLRWWHTGEGTEWWGMAIRRVE